MSLGPRATYFFGNRVVATVRIPPHSCAPCSIAWFCQTCGELWARALVEGGETDWRLNTTPCAKHVGITAVDWSRIPGSLSQGQRQQDLGAFLWAQALDVLPPDLQNREVLCAIAHAERNA